MEFNAPEQQRQPPELLKTFNCGIGMMLVVDKARAGDIAALLEGMGESVSRIGTIVQGEGVIYKGRLL
jgi:phosphoribosylformylglycinamidine cyclo-ligase